MRADRGFVAVYILVTLSLIVAGSALLISLGQAPAHGGALAVLLAATAFGGLGLYIEARRDLYAFSMYATVLASLTLIASIAVAAMFDGGRSVSIPLAVLAAIVGAATGTYIVRSQFGTDAVPNILRQRVPDSAIYEMHDVQFSGARTAASVSPTQAGEARIVLQNCADAPRTVHLRLVDKPALLSGAGRLIYAQPEPVRLGPGEAGELAIPVLASDAARGALDLYWSAKVLGARGRRIRKWHAQGLPPRIPLWLTAVLGAFALLFGGLIAWGGGVRFRFQIVPGGRTDGEAAARHHPANATWTVVWSQ
jgi:hypothetical protein